MLLPFSAKFPFFSGTEVSKTTIGRSVSAERYNSIIYNLYGKKKNVTVTFKDNITRGLWDASFHHNHPGMVTRFRW